jgi:phosphatidylglycerophosphate synthase
MRENIVQISFKKFWERSFAVSCFPPTWHIFQRLGGVLAFIAYKIGLSPNMITLIGGLTGTYAIWQFSVLPLGLLETVHLSLVFSFVYILDCADGQLARATGKTSKLGKWFDIGVDFYLIILFPVGISIFIKSLHIGPNIDWMVMGLIIGRALVLITSSLKRSGGEDHHPSSSYVKKIIQSILDTPVFYLWICWARLNPEWLIMSALFFGVLYIIESIYLSRTFFK